MNKILGINFQRKSDGLFAAFLLRPKDMIITDDEVTKTSDHGGIIRAQSTADKLRHRRLRHVNAPVITEMMKSGK